MNKNSPEHRTRQLLLLTGSFLLLCLLISTLLTPFPAKSSPGPSLLPELGAAAADEAAFRLSAYNGRVAAFRAGEEEPLYVADRLISDLPPADQERLLNGIPAPTRHDLTRLLEEYCS